MKNILLVLCAFAALITRQATAAGGDVGNGGDVIFCGPSPGNSLRGHYLLDYVIGFESSLFTLPPDQEPRDYSRLVDRLTERLPDLGRDLKYYLEDAKKQIFGKADITRPHVWVEERQGLQDLRDEFLIKKIPANCLSEGKPMAYQAVYREERAESILYHYDSNQVSRLRDQSPLQLSMLLVHEWIWYFAANANVVRDVNLYLHSREFLSDNRDRTVLTLRRLGFNLEKPLREPEPARVLITIRSCDFRQTTTVKAPAGLGVRLVVLNESTCGFNLFEGRVPKISVLDAEWRKSQMRGAPNYFPTMEYDVGVFRPGQQLDMQVSFEAPLERPQGPGFPGPIFPLLIVQPAD